MSAGKKEDPKLDFTKKAKDEGGETGSYISGGVTITVTKNNLGNGFFKRVHQPNKTLDFSGAFSNSFYERIGNGTTTLKDLKTATFYFWEKEETNPLFLEVTLQGGKKPQYYYRYRKDEIEGITITSWTYIKDEHELQQRLDDRNCGINKAIVYDLQNSYSTASSTESSDGNTNSDCKSEKRKITKKTPASITSPKDYTVKEYNIQSKKSDTRISRVTYGRASTTGIEPPNEAVSNIRVYYWAHGDTEKTIPLLIEFKPQATGKQSTWFENTSQESTTWKPVTNTTDFYDPTGQPKQELTTKLDEVNCNVNNVVQIKVTEQTNTTYCHDHLNDGHANKKRISVKDATEEYGGKNLFNYKVYSHTPNPTAYTEDTTPKKFIVSKFFKNGEGLTGIIQPTTTHIKDVTKVLVYFCSLKSTEPLLIYYEQQTTSSSTTHNWYRKPDGTGTWTTVPLLSSTSPNQHTEILEQLDKIRSPCQPPSVTIDIKNGPNGENLTYTDEKSTPDPPGNHTIQVEGNEDPAGSNYKSFTHTVQNNNTRRYFTVQSVKYGEHNIQNVANIPIEKVKDVKVYYWGPLKDKGNPLLIKIEKHGSSAEWYENKSDNKENTTWQKITEPYKDKLNNKEDNLLNKLILLNCKLNNVTSIDIGKKPDQSYCHDKDSSVGETEHEELIQVTNVTDTEPYKDGNKLGKFVVYKHAVNPDVLSKKSLPLDKKFHISKFKKDSQPIQLEGEPQPPFLYVSEVLVFWCSSEPNGSPLLVHFKHSSTPSETEKEEWYKKDGETDWKEVVGQEIPKSETDTKKIYDILNGYKTKCKSWVKEIVITTVSVAGGSGVIGGAGYATYWYFFLRDPWWRLM